MTDRPITEHPDVAAAIAAYEAANAERREAERYEIDAQRHLGAVIAAHHGLAIGDTVTDYRGKNGVITHFEGSPWGSSSVIGALLNKDGTRPRRASSYLGSAELLTKVEVAQ